MATIIFNIGYSWVIFNQNVNLSSMAQSSKLTEFIIWSKLINLNTKS